MRRVLLYVPMHRELPVARSSWFMQYAPDTEIDIFIMRSNPHPGKGAYPNLDIKNEAARRAAIVGRYDELFIVEDDVVLPVDALAELLSAHAPFIVALYRGRPENWGSDRLSVRIYDPEGPQDADDRPLELMDIPADNPIITCTGIAMGCTLIHRTLFETIEGVVGRDYELGKRLMENGIPMLCHTGVRCGHVTAKGEIIEV